MLINSTDELSDILRDDSQIVDTTSVEAASNALDIISQLASAAIKNALSGNISELDASSLANTSVTVSSGSVIEHLCILP